MQAMAGTMWALGAANKAPAVSWWLSGGISAANCVAAYAPKGAADLAASYTNLANPGTYTAAPGTAPTWDATGGWTFVTASSQYLTTGITPASDYSWSILVRFSNGTTAANSYLCGCRNATFRFYLNHSDGSGNHLYGHGGALTVATAKASGVMAFAGATSYLNGASEGAIAAGSGTLDRALVIGALNSSGTVAGFGSNKIQAVAIYNTALTLAQVQALTTAMNAL